jgi:twitching motility protein PilT
MSMTVLSKREIVDRLKWARDNDCQDVWLSANEPFAYERMGDLVVDQERRVDEVGFKAFLDEVLTKPDGSPDTYNRKRLEEEGAFRAARTHEQFGRVRIKAYRRMGGLALSTRLLSTRPYGVRELDLPEIFEELAYIPGGLVVLCGPTGSGKSSAVATLIDTRHARIPSHTMIVGDPVEFIHTSKTSFIDHQEIGVEYETTEQALETILSARAHVVVPPELFTARQIGLAVTLAETNHAVYAQIHAGNCTEALLRLIEAVSLEDGGNGRARLAQSLVAIVATRLVRRKDVGEGKAARRAVVEVLVNTPKIRGVIHDPSRFIEVKDAIHQGRDYGMMTFGQHVRQLAGRGQIAHETQIFTDAAELLKTRLGTKKTA